MQKCSKTLHVYNKVEISGNIRVVETSDNVCVESLVLIGKLLVSPEFGFGDFRKTTPKSFRNLPCYRDYGSTFFVYDRKIVLKDS